MKIVSWNCNGCLRNKIDYLLTIKADLYVIQESENPTNHSLLINKINRYIWHGPDNNKGLLVFTGNDISINETQLEYYGLRHFINLSVDNSFNMIALWIPYIEEYYIFHQIYHDIITNNTIIIGDFNSNSKWDKKHKERNHSEVVKQLESIGLVSAYHYLSNEKQGNETNHTFYLHRNINKGHYIDYCFVKPSRIKAFDIGKPDYWLRCSDHMPIIVDLEI